MKKLFTSQNFDISRGFLFVCFSACSYPYCCVFWHKRIDTHRVSNIWCFSCSLVALRLSKIWLVRNVGNLDIVHCGQNHSFWSLWIIFKPGKSTEWKYDCLWDPPQPFMTKVWISTKLIVFYRVLNLVKIPSSVLKCRGRFPKA